MVVLLMSALPLLLVAQTKTTGQTVNEMAAAEYLDSNQLGSRPGSNTP